MAREIIQIIRCDRCGNKIETEDEVVRMTISIGQTTYELEVDELCDNFGLWTLEDVIEKGHVQKNTKRTSKKKPAATATTELICPVCKRTDFESSQGLSMHRTRADHWTKDDPRPDSATRKKAQRDRVKDQGEVKGYLVRS